MSARLRTLSRRGEPGGDSGGAMRANAEHGPPPGDVRDGGSRPRGACRVPRSHTAGESAGAAGPGSATASGPSVRVGRDHSAGSTLARARPCGLHDRRRRPRAARRLLRRGADLRQHPAAGARARRTPSWPSSTRAALPSEQAVRRRHGAERHRRGREQRGQTLVLGDFLRHGPLRRAPAHGGVALGRGPVPREARPARRAGRRRSPRRRARSRAARRSPPMAAAARSCSAGWRGPRRSPARGSSGGRSAPSSSGSTPPGRFAWVSLPPSGSDSDEIGIKVDRDGNAILASQDGRGTATFVTKLDRNGELVWHKRFRGSPDQLEEAYDLAVDPKAPRCSPAAASSASPICRAARGRSSPRSARTAA